MSRGKVISCKWCNETHTGPVNLVRGGSNLRGDFECGQCGRGCTVELTEEEFQKLLASGKTKGAQGAAPEKTPTGPAAA